MIHIKKLSNRNIHAEGMNVDVYQYLFGASLLAVQAGVLSTNPQLLSNLE